jgi:predicted RNA-binding protein with EMAP domain
MIDLKFAQQLYDALCGVLDAIDNAGVLEVGGQSLRYAYKEADELLQSEEADNLLDEIARTLNAMS